MPDLVHPLSDDDSEKVMNVHSSWCLIAVLADTGATKHVTPNGIFSAGVQDTEKSKANHKFYAANSQAIPNLGGQTVAAISTNNKQIGMDFNVAEIARPIASIEKYVARITVLFLTRKVRTLKTNPTVHGCQCVAKGTSCMWTFGAKCRRSLPITHLSGRSSTNQCDTQDRKPSSA